MTTKYWTNYDVNLTVDSQYGDLDFRNCISFCPRMRTHTF